MSALALLDVCKLNKSFGGLRVTRDVSLSLEPGARVGLIGPNGAGKTTLINLMTGVLTPTSGTMHLNGEDVSGLRQSQRVKRGLVRTFQITQLAHLLPVYRQVEMAIHERLGSVKSLFRPLGAFTVVREEARHILDTLQLGRLAPRCPIELAYGEQRLVEVALAMALKPTVLLLDEPMAGVPSGERQVILDALATLPDDLAILMIEHDMDLVFSFAKRIVVLADGTVLAKGPPDDIRRHPAVRSVYLGTEA